MKEITNSWIEFGKRDFRIAEKNIEDEYLSNIVTFHSHQCVEKIFKALLSEYGVYFPRVHDIYKLFELIPGEIKTVLRINEDDLIKINEVYLDSRYPSEVGLLPSGFPSREQAKIIFDKTREIFDRVLNILETSK